MDRTLIVCPSHRGVELQTQKCLVECQQHGARLVSLSGIADVALARNEALTLALGRQENADICLLIDDDMVFQLSAVRKLVSLARQTGGVWSGAYATIDGKLAATRFDWDGKRNDGLWMVGLGFCAVPFQKLQTLAAELGVVTGPQGKLIVPFCQSGVVVPEHDKIPRWCSEDYWLCRALGGVRLAPYVAAGHLKTVPLWPDEPTLERLAKSQPLSWEPEPLPEPEPELDHAPAAAAPTTETTPAPAELEPAPEAVELEQPPPAATVLEATSLKDTALEAPPSSPKPKPSRKRDAKRRSKPQKAKKSHAAAAVA